MKNKNREVQDLVSLCQEKLKEWINTVNGIGNQDAFTDRLLEEFFMLSRRLEDTYESQFKEDK